jgi:hypothetical protein
MRILKCNINYYTITITILNTVVVTLPPGINPTAVK